MDDLSRLEHGDVTDFERELLRSARQDGPSAAARARTLAALGVATSVVATATAAKAATEQAALAGGAQGASVGAGAGAVGAAGAAAGGANGAGAAGSLLGGWAALKWLGVGAVAGIVSTGGVALVTAPARPAVRAEVPVSAMTRVAADAPSPARSPVTPLRPAEEPPSAAPQVAPSRPAHVASPAEGPPSAAPQVAPSRPARVAIPANEPEVVVPVPDVATAPAPASSVVAEVSSLDRARAALAAGDARAALSRLAVHERTFRGAALEPEAVLLRVRALRELGQRAAARSVAEAYIEAHPGGGQAARLRSIVNAP